MRWRGYWHPRWHHNPGQVNTTKLPVTAIHVLNNDVLPFFEKHRARVHAGISDNGREYCGRPDRHPYELFLQLEDIEHRKTKVRSPQTNGLVERLHRTFLDEHFRIVGRTKWFRYRSKEGVEFVLYGSVFLVV